MFLLRFRFSPLCFFVVLLLTPLWAQAEDAPWRELEPGISFAAFTPEVPSFYPPTITVLRLDPDRVDFVLLNASAEGRAYSFTQWAERYDLVAAINASMFLPDALTSTGYMRSAEHVNSPRIVANFGAFFVAEPRKEGLPQAALLDRVKDPWEELLDDYAIVIQNYRMISAEGRMLWIPGGASYAVAAVAQDMQGNILFIHCREPMEGAQFGDILLTLPLALRMVMYVEGGSQSGLLVKAGTMDELWMGRRFADFWTAGSKDAPLPNILGVRRRIVQP